MHAYLMKVTAVILLDLSAASDTFIIKYSFTTSNSGLSGPVLRVHGSDGDP